MSKKVVIVFDKDSSEFTYFLSLFMIWIIEDNKDNDIPIGDFIEVFLKRKNINNEDAILCINFKYDDIVDSTQSQDIYLHRAGIDPSLLTDQLRYKIINNLARILMNLEHNYYQYKNPKNSYAGISNVPLKYFENQGFNDNNPSPPRYIKSQIW